MRLARALAERIHALHFEDLPAAAVYGSRVAVLDTLGVMLAGSGEAAPRIVEEVLALDNAAGPCLLFGTARRAGCLDAALVNGVAAHVLDFDNTASNLGGHVSAVMVPALIAAAEAFGASGRDLLLGQVSTYVGLRKDDFAYMREHLAELVVKTTGDSGGYNMLMGPFATRKEIDAYAAQMRKAPGNYIAQPLIELSSHPTWVGGTFEPRRIDLRPFILCGQSIRVLPGGLTRVALRRGSYVVNSSQGGGSKDTWVLAPRGA
jgi:hypothetical protein